MSIDQLSPGPGSSRPDGYVSAEVVPD